MFDIKVPKLQARIFENGNGDFTVALVDEEENVLEYAIFSNESDAHTAAQFISDFIQFVFDGKKTAFKYQALHKSLTKKD